MLVQPSICILWPRCTQSPDVVVRVTLGLGMTPLYPGLPLRMRMRKG